MSRMADRIIDVFPSGSYALAGLLRLLDIVETDRVATAAIECTAQPRLLVNPGFVDRYAATPERLLMLVLHELHHVLLGHTTLFPRATAVLNFVFDAVINALISRMYPRPEHTSFLTGFYGQDSFPECLLRPPADWRVDGAVQVPSGIAALPVRVRAAVADVYLGLYSATGVSYQEVYDVLPRLLDGCDVARIPLLGGHDDSGSERPTSPLLVDLVREIVEQWPQPPDPIRGRSLADLLQPRRVQHRRVPSNRTILRGVIRRVADVGCNGRVSIAAGVRPLLVASAIPTMDRRTIVQRALGGHPMLHGATVDDRRRAPRGDRVHVYVDVSGSMGNLKNAIYGAVLDCSDSVQRPIHLFSTQVVDITLHELRRGVCRTTGGTDIGCVADHSGRESNPSRRRYHRRVCRQAAWRAPRRPVEDAAGHLLCRRGRQC